MNLETAIKLQDELTDLAKLSRKGCKGHWKNFGFTHGYGSYDLSLVDAKVGDTLPIYWYTIVGTGKKTILDLMYQISTIINKYVAPETGWHVDYNGGNIQINIP